MTIEDSSPAAPDQASVVVLHDAESSRYLIRLDQTQVGLADYEQTGDSLAFVHTEISPAYGGRGLAGTLIKYALDDARRQGLTVLPYCSFVRGYIAKHPEYLGLVEPSKRARFQL